MGPAAHAAEPDRGDIVWVHPEYAASVLVVDDDAAFRVLLRQLVEGAGLSVVAEASNGAEGIALAAALKPDVITMDLDMPVLDGVAAIAELRTAGAGAVVVVSGSQSSEQVAEALVAGARWHVAKRDVADQLPDVLRALAQLVTDCY
jgi:CheY-like chemotaxis protein